MPIIVHITPGIRKLRVTALEIHYTFRILLISVSEEYTVCDILFQATKCCRVIGYYVPAEVWCKIVLPAVRTSAGCYVTGSNQASTVAVGPVQCTSCLRVLVGLLHGSTPSGVKDYLQVRKLLHFMYE